MVYSVNPKMDYNNIDKTTETRLQITGELWRITGEFSKFSDFGAERVISGNFKIIIRSDVSVRITQLGT